MLHGDISNHRSFIIGFRCENCLIRYRNTSLKDKLMNVVKGKNHNAVLDIRVLTLIRYLYERTDYTVSLIVKQENYTDELKEFLNEMNVPYNQIGNIIKHESEISMMLNVGEIDYYVDTDEARLSLIGNKFAMNLEDFKKLLGRIKVF